MSVYRTRNGAIGNSIKNSLSDILPNKNVDSAERAKFQQSQNASLVKALNNIENPVKEKHVRNIILGTCYEKSAIPFWYGAIKLQLKGSPITCWKFCYTLHKLIRDGYSTTVDDSFRFINTLEDLSKSWVHLPQDYGNMLFHYLNYLNFKIKFHKKNQIIPGNLIIEDTNLNELASNDINNYFQLCCEFFDYADEIIGLQNAVFVTMDRSRSNSMTENGQCKLQPLVLCIQETNQLYDFCVQFLFKLHDELPADILIGHRERFFNIFKQV
jgi:huntingtin interacting protein 1